MPPLTNYSGYDRDNRTYLPGYAPKDSVTEKVENKHSFGDNQSGASQKANKPQLSESAQLVIKWLKEKRPKQWVKFKGKDDRDMTFINFLSDKSIKVFQRDEIFQQLVTTKFIEISADGDYLRLIQF